MTNDQRIELLPCPFCGGEAKLYWPQGDGHVSCEACHVTVWAGIGFGTFDEQYLVNSAAWNRRATDQAPADVKSAEELPDGMVRIATLIEQLQDIHKIFGNTGVFMREMSWGGLAMSRRDKHDDFRAKDKATIEKLRDDLQYFVDRVDRGEARSKVTYARFKQTLAETEGA